MTSNNDPRSINTGGGAYFGGNVETQGGDLVGRDQIKTVNQQQGASVEDLAKLLAEVRNLLPHLGLDQDLAEAIEGDFRVVEAQTAKEQPKGGLIKTKLAGMTEVIQEAGKTSDAVEKVLKLLGRAATLAGALF